MAVGARREPVADLAEVDALRGVAWTMADATACAGEVGPALFRLQFRFSGVRAGRCMDASSLCAVTASDPVRTALHLLSLLSIRGGGSQLCVACAIALRSGPSV